MPETRTAYLFAGSLDEARNYARRTFIDGTTEWAYISSVDSLRGRILTRDDVRVVGTFWQRSDASLIVNTLAQMGVEL